MVERGEVPDGMADVIRYESLRLLRTMAQRRPEKSREALISGQAGEPRAETGL
jgi:hypothetical protein